LIVRELWARLGVQVDQSSVSKADSMIKGLKRSLGGLAAGWGLAQGVQAVQKAINDMGEAARQLALDSQRTGLDPQFLQELEFAAKRTGVSAEGLQHGLVHLSRAAYEAATSGGAAGAAFQRLGIQVKGSDGKLRPIREMLADVADKFQAMPDGDEKLALSTQLLSRAGAELIPFFDEGSAGLARLGAEFRKTGAAMTNTMIRDGKRAAEAMDNVRYAIKGVTNTIFGSMLPGITQSRKELAHWLEVNRKIIAARVQDVFNTITKALKGVVAAVEMFPRTFAVAGAALALWISPMTAGVAAVVAAFALLAEDLYSYFAEGNSSSITFLLIGFFKLLKKKLKEIWSDFTDDPFGFLLRNAKATFDKIVEEAKKLPARLNAAMQPKGTIRGLLDTLAPTDEQSGHNPLGGINIFRLWGKEIDAFNEMLNPASLVGPSLPMTGGGGFTSSGINIGSVNVTAPVGADAKQFAASFKEELNRIVSDNFDVSFNLRMRDAKP
jgi:hypothetical protein